MISLVFEMIKCDLRLYLEGKKEGYISCFYSFKEQM